jgi:uncharacterized protein (TIGR02757 family)
MKTFLRSLLDRMGESPHRFVMTGDYSSLRGLYYRFHKEAEIRALFAALRRAPEEYGTLGNMARSLYRGDTRELVWRICEGLFPKGDNLLFFFPRPSRTNPLKRWNLYFRWMARKDEIDFGLWDFIDKRSLIVPLDTHLFKVGRCMGWIRQKTQSHKAALELTEALKAFSPEDPLKYDFFLCHRVGIEAGCRGVRDAACKDRCVLYDETSKK